MIPYRKFSDILWDEIGGSRAPSPPKAPILNPEGVNDGRTLDGLGALGAPTADLQNQPERNAVITVVTDRSVVGSLLAGDERAGFLEHDGGWVRADAEFQAFDCSVVEWLNQHPAPSQSGRDRLVGTS
jgi:hypothetical protein